MKCPKCGKELKEGTKFCVGCGTKLTNAEESVKKEVVNEEKVKETVAALGYTLQGFSSEESTKKHFWQRS